MISHPFRQVIQRIDRFHVPILRADRMTIMLAVRHKHIIEPVAIAPELVLVPMSQQFVADNLRTLGIAHVRNRAIWRAA